MLEVWRHIIQWFDTTFEQRGVFVVTVEKIDVVKTEHPLFGTDAGSFCVIQVQFWRKLECKLGLDP